MSLERTCRMIIPAPDGRSARACGQKLATTFPKRSRDGVGVTYCPNCDGRACPDCGAMSNPGNPYNHEPNCERTPR